MTGATPFSFFLGDDMVGLLDGWYISMWGVDEMNQLFS